MIGWIFQPQLQFTMTIHSGVKYLFLFFTSLLEDFMNLQLRSLWRTSCSAALGLVLAAVTSFAGNSTQPSPLAQTKELTTARANSLIAKTGLEFVENKGQVVDTKGTARPDIKFSASSKGVGLFFTPDRIIYAYSKTEGSIPDIRDAKPKEHFKGVSTTLYRMDMSLVGASTSANIVPTNQLPGVQNFYTASTGIEGVTGVRGFGKITYENVYPNIDMVLVSRGKGMKAEFIVRPGGDPSLIKMRFDGAKSVNLERDGGYTVATEFGTLSEDAPYSYVNVNGEQQEVKATFRVEGNEVTFNVPSYDKSQTLVIDPAREWGSFHGLTGEDRIQGISAQPSFNPATGDAYIYVCGFTSTITSTVPFTTAGTSGSVSTNTRGGTYDAFAAAYSYGTGARVFNTAFGGSGEDRANAIVANSAGLSWVVGQTAGSSFPTSNTGNTQTAYGGDVFDGFVTALSASGTITASSYVGGLGDDYLTSICRDDAGNLTVCGTASTASTGLGAGSVYQVNPGSGQYSAIISRITVSTGVVRDWLSYYGTGVGSECYGTSVASTNTTGEIWIGGFTNCPNTGQAIATTGSYNTFVNNNGSGASTGSVRYDGWVARFTSTGGRTSSTYVGGQQDDRVFGVANDVVNNRVIAVGGTNSVSSGTQNIANTSGVFKSTLNHSSSTSSDDGFVTALSLSGSNFVRAWGTYWGTALDDRLYSVSVDNSAASSGNPENKGQKIFVAGQSNAAVSGASPNDFATYGTYNFSIGTNNTAGGAYDAVWSQFTSDGTGVELTTINGTTGNDCFTGIAVDSMRNVLVAGFSESNSTSGNIGTGSSAQPTSAASGLSDGIVMKYCNLIVPITPTLSTNNGSSFSGSATICLSNNSSAIGSTGFSGTGTCNASAVQTLIVRVSNAVRGVSYRPYYATTGTAVPAAPATTGYTALATAQVAGADGNLDFTISNISAAFGGAGTYDIFFQATTQSACAENGAVSTIIVAAQPSNNSIVHSDVTGGTIYSNNGAIAPNGSSITGTPAINFIGVGSTSISVRPQTYVAANTYSVCAYRLTGNASSPMTFTWSGATSAVGAGNPVFTLALGDNAATGDTIRIRMREVNVAGCVNEYVSTFYVAPVEQVTLNLPAANNNPNVMCSPSSSAANFSASPLGNPYTSITFNYASAPTFAFSWTTVSTGGGTGLTTGNGIALGAGPTLGVTPTFGTASAEATTLSLAGVPTSSTIFTNVRLTETVTAAAYSATKSYTKELAISASPSVTFPAVQNICEGSVANVTFTVSPSLPAGSSWTANLDDNGGSVTGESLVSSSGTFSGTSFTVSINTGNVAAAYDALGNLRLNVTVTNSASGTCTTTAPTSGFTQVISLTQKPDASANFTVAAPTSSLPVGMTPAATAVPGPIGTGTAFTSPVNSGTTIQACQFNGPGAYGIAYTYTLATPNNGTGTDSWSYSVTGGTITSATSGVGLNAITVQWNTAGAQQIQVVQTNDQAPGTCQTTTTYPVNVNLAPSPVTVTWQKSSNYCEGEAVQFTITNPNANPVNVQIYGETATVSGGGVWTPGFNSPQTVTVAGNSTSAVTTLTGSASATMTTVTPPGFTDLTYRFIVKDNTTGCAAFANAAGSYATFTTPSVRVWDTPAVPTATGPSPVCPNWITLDKNNPTNAVLILSPAVDPGASVYTISNLSSYPSGTTFAWSISGFTAGTDYTLSTANSGGYFGNTATFRFKKNMVGARNLLVSITYPSPASCALSATSAIAIVISPVPNPQIITNTVDANGALSLSSTPNPPGGLCSGNTAIYNAGAATTYAWSYTGAPAGTTNGAANTQNFSVTWGQFFTPSLVKPVLTVVQQDASGCFQVDTASVYLRPVPLATVSQVIPTNGPCVFNNENSHIVAYTVPKNPAYQISSVVWTVSANGSIYSYTTTNNAVLGYSGVVAGANDTVRIQWNSAGAGTVTAVVTNLNNCSATGVLNTFVFPVPNPVISGAAAICKGTTTTYNVNPNIGGDSYTWEIIPSVSGNTINSGNGTPSINVTWGGVANTVYTLRCTQVSAAGCTARTTFAVTLNPNPTPTISGPTGVCANGTATYSTQNNAPSNSYVWTLTPGGGGGTAASIASGQNTASIVINTGSQASYSLTVTETVNSTSCTTTSSAYPVTVSAAPTATITRSGSGVVGSACTGIAYTYTANPTPSSGITYQWYLNGTPLAGQTNQTYATTWNATGTNTLGVMVTLSSTQCSTLVNQTVVVSNSPAPAISGPATVCGGGASPLLTYTYTTPLTTGNTYTWTFPGGGATSVTATSGTGVNSVTVQWSGTVVARSVRVVETDPNTGCSTTSADYNVTVTTRPNPTMPTPGAACQNGSTQNYTVSGLISGSTRAYTVTGGNFTVTTGATSDVVNVNWTAAGTGTVQITETNGACSFTNSFNVTVNPAPTAYNVNTSTPNICATGGSSSNVTAATITLSGSQTGVNYQIVQNGTGLGTIGTADGTNVKAGNGSGLNWTITPGSTGTFNYTILAQNTTTGCQTTQTGTAVVAVNTNPNATITGATSVCSGVAVVYSVTAAANQAYAWTVPAGWTIVSGSNSSALTVTPTTTSGTVAVIVSNSVTGCSNNSSVSVTVTAAPTAFNVTPASGAICLGTGTTLGLSGSASGVTYTVLKGSQVITTAAGTGSALTITIPSSAVNTVGTHTFTVTATANAAPCNTTTINMNGSLTVTVNPLPTPVISGPSTACIGQAVTFSTPSSGNNFAWTISSGTGTIAPPTNTNSVTMTFTGTAGSRTVQVVETNPNTGCTQSTTYTLTANATPAPSVTPGPTQTVCAGSTVTYSTTNTVGNTYSWVVNGAGGQIIGGQGSSSISVQWGTAAGTGTVTVTETAGTCSNSSTSTVTVNALPVAYTVNTTTPGVCVPGTATITLSNSQTGFVYTLIRNGVAQTPTVTGNGGGIQFTNSITTAGTYAYTISATGAGCTNLMTGTATVTATNPPTPTISGAASVCANSSSTYAVTPVNAGSTYAFTVSGSGNTLGAQVGNQQTVNWGTNSGTLSVIETDAANCSGSASFAVTVNALPTAQTVTLSPTTVCAGGGLGSNSTTATVGLANSQTGYTYELLSAANNVVRTATGTGAALSFSPAFTNLSPGSITWTVRAISNTTPNCTTAAMANSVTLTVVPNPAPAVTGPTTPCQNATVTYQTTNNTGSTYAWNVVSGTGSFTPTNTYQVTGSWSSIGTASIRVVETNANGCAQENILTVNITTAPTPTITATPSTSPVCGGSSVTYSTTASGTSYNWTVGSNGTINSGNGTNSIVVSWANATPDVAYTSAVNLTVNNGGCTGSTSMPVTVNPKANPTITGDAARCHGQTGSYSTPFVVSGRSYAWTISNLPPGMTFTPVSGVNQNSLNVNWVNTGSVPVVATVQVVETPANSGNTCTGTSTFNVTVNPLPSVTITGANQVCQNTTVSYTATPTQTGLSYAWNVTGANSFTGQGTATISVNWGSTNGTIQLTVTNASTGCTNTATNNNMAVTVTPTPTPGIATPPGTTACAGSTVTYNVLNPSSSFTYTWNNTGAVSASTPSGNSYTVTWPNTPGNGTITLTATTTGGVTCVGSTTRNITIAPNPAPSITGATAVCPNQDQTYSTPFVANDTYSWSLPAGTYIITGGSLTGNTVTVRWNNPGTTAATRVVTVTETSPNNCVGTATVNVTVNPAPIPNISGNTNVCGYMATYDGVSINNTETYTVTNPVNNQSTFVWSMPNGGGTFVSSSQGVNVTSVTVQWNEPTASASLTRVLRVTETTNAIPNCTGQTDINVQVNWNPKPAITGNRVVCSNSQYSANSTSAQQYSPYTYTTPGLNQTINPPASTYVWDVRDVNNVSILTSNPATTSPGARITGSGNQVQVEYFNPTNAPVTMVLRVTETIQYSNSLQTPSVKACPLTDSFVVVVNPLPKPVIAPAPTDVCGRSTATYATTGDANSTFNWTVGTGVIVGAANANNVTITWNDVTADNTPGFVQVSQTFNATGCSTTVRQNVNVDVTPTPVIAGPTVLCQGTTNGTNQGTYNVVSVLPNRAYLWSIDTPTSGPVTITAGPNNLPSFQISVNGNTSVPVTCVIRLRETATDATNNGNAGNGCFAETTYTVTLNPNPTPVITSSTGGLNVNGVCAGSSHSYSTTFNAGNTYSWTVVGGTIVGSATNNSVSITWGAAGAGSVAVRERVGTIGCYTDVSTPITIRPLPNPDLSNQTGGVNPPSVCAQSTRTYTTPLVVGDSYVWTVTGGTIASGQSSNTIVVNWGAAGSGTVSVTETTPVTLGSCQATRTLAVTINPLPTPSIQGPPQPPVCINSTQTYTTANIAGNTYVWGPIVGGNIVGANNTNTVNVQWTAAGSGTVTVTETITATGCTASTTRTIPVNALPVVNITPSSTTNLCAGQSVTLAATDGFVSYTWSTGETTPRITVRQAGTYSVTVVDGNGCQNTSSSISVTVSAFTKPTIAINGTNNFCQGESRTLSAVATGGTPLAYRWNNGATTPSINVTTSGTYNCEITYSSTCKIMSDDITVTVSPKPSVSITANGPVTFCDGGSVTLDAGAGYVTYAWFNGSTPAGNGRTLKVTTTGNYTVQVTNAGGCPGTSAETKVKVNPNPTPTIQSTPDGKTEFCQGDSVTLDAGPGYKTYSWSSGEKTQSIVVKTSGSYSVTVTDTNDCSGQSAVKKIVVFQTPQKPGVTRVINTLDADTTFKTYQWYKNGQPISGATTSRYIVSDTGNYQVRITDVNGCTNISDNIHIDNVVGVGDQIFAEQNIVLYPNPTNGNLNVRFNTDRDFNAAQLSVRNLIGNEVMTSTFNALNSGENVRSIDMSRLPNGLYVVEIALPNGQRLMARITKVD